MHLQVAHLDKEVQSLKTGLAARDEQVNGLVKKVATLEAEADRREQYSRRPNLCFQGILEEDGENTDAVVIGMYNPAEAGFDPHCCRSPRAEPPTRSEAGQAGPAVQVGNEWLLPQRGGAVVAR